MALTPAVTDKFTHVGNPGTATTLAAPGFTSGVSTAINVGSTTNWPVDTLVRFAIDVATIINGLEVRTAGTYNEFSGIVTSATTIGSLTRELGTAQNYNASSLTRIYIPVASTRENALVDGLAQDHNLKGNHKTLTDDNGLTWLERGSVASAVNQVKISNAITGVKPTIAANGTDATVGLSIVSKGAANVEVSPGAVGGVVKIDGSVPKSFFALYNFVESGCIITADSVGVNKNYSMSSGFVWIAGKRLSVAAVSAQTVGASKDRYIDYQDNGDGTAVPTITEATNNTISPPIANAKTDTDNIRIGVVVAGATTIATTGSINQGQETAVLPLVSSVAYSVTDGLGNLICPRDPNRKVLGYRQILTTYFHTSAISQVTGLSVPINVPTGRKVKVTVMGQYILTDAAADLKLSIWDGVVSSGTQLALSQTYGATTGVGYTAAVSCGSVTLSAGSHTINLGMAGSAGNQTLGAGATSPAYVLIELI